MRLEYFDMIDRVVQLDRAAWRIEAQATVPTESPVFEGHFPGHPLVPGVLLTETSDRQAPVAVGVLDEAGLDAEVVADEEGEATAVVARRVPGR